VVNPSNLFPINISGYTVCEIKHEACSQDANKALGEAEYFISIKATRLVLYFMYSTSKAMLYCFIEFSRQTI